MTKTFISYRHVDSQGETDHITDRLVARFGKPNVFMDADIPPGVQYPDYVKERVGRCSLLLAVIGKGWLNAQYSEGPKKGQRRLDDPDDLVRIEILTGLDRGIPIIPVLVSKADLPHESFLPEPLKPFLKWEAAEIRPGKDFSHDMEELIRAIEALSDGRQTARPGVPVPQWTAQASRLSYSRDLPHPYGFMCEELHETWLPAVAGKEEGGLSLPDVLELLFRSVVNGMLAPLDRQAGAPDLGGLLMRIRENHTVPERLPQHDQIEWRRLRNLGLIEHPEGTYLFDHPRCRQVGLTESGRVILALHDRDRMLDVEAVSRRVVQRLVAIRQDRDMLALLGQVRETGRYSGVQTKLARRLRNLNLIDHESDKLVQTDRVRLTDLGYLVLRKFM